MASVNYRNKRAEVRFYDHQGNRRTVALGAIPKRAAESAASHIQSLVNSKIGGLQPYPENFTWASDQRPRVVDYLARLGLIQPRQTEVIAVQPEIELATTLEQWFNEYIEGRNPVEGTRHVWNRAKNQAMKFLGRFRRIDSISVSDAITWSERMLKGDSKGKGKLAVATAHKMMGVCRQVFERAKTFEHIKKNPFVDKSLKVAVGHREKDYIDVPTVQQWLKILPSTEWRALIVFARFAGM